TWALVVERVTRTELALSAREAAALRAHMAIDPRRFAVLLSARGLVAPLSTVVVRPEGHTKGTGGVQGRIKGA
ncbi:hypothetical protein, partial [Streptomyces sp. NPDC000851]